jgi:hypothetical protein
LARPAPVADESGHEAVVVQRVTGFGGV